MSELKDNHLLQHLSYGERSTTYERIWDEADYVIPPSEHHGFFVMTNAVITPNQIRSTCPEDHLELPNTTCILNQDTKRTKKDNQNNCLENKIFNYKRHGPETGKCVKSDRGGNGKIYVCEVSAWCPVELDMLPIQDEPLLKNTDKFTVLIKNAISFTRFGANTYRRHNMPNGICKYKPNDTSSHLCPIFELGDIVELAGGRKMNCNMIQSMPHNYEILFFKFLVYILCHMHIAFV